MDASEIKTEWGSIRITDNALSAIVNMTALSVPGVARMDNSFVHDLSSMISRSEHTDGVHVVFRKDTVDISLYVVVYHGMRIPDLVLRLQENVKTAVETMGGMIVSSVDVYVQSIEFDGIQSH